MCIGKIFFTEFLQGDPARSRQERNSFGALNLAFSKCFAALAITHATARFKAEETAVIPNDWLNETSVAQLFRCWSSSCIAFEASASAIAFRDFKSKIGVPAVI